MEQEIKKQNNSAKFAFFYVLSFVALVFMSFGVGITLFQIINKFVIDILEGGGRYQPDALKFAISALLIATPIFYITTREIHKNLFSGALEKNSEIRKWLTYFILLITSVIMIAWFIAVVNGFLEGELTLKFGLKSLVAIGINAGIFLFYLYDIKRDEVKGVKNKTVKLYLYVSLFVVITVFISALFVVESPTETRNRKIDQRVMRNISRIENAIESYYREFDMMPEDYEALKDNERYLVDENFENVSTKKQIQYKIVEDKQYELCTDFLASNQNQEDSRGMYYEERNDNLHDSGYQCFKRKIKVIEEDRDVMLKTIVD